MQCFKLNYTPESCSHSINATKSDPTKLPNCTTLQKSTSHSGQRQLLLNVAFILSFFFFFNFSRQTKKKWLHINKMVCQFGDKYSAFLLGTYCFILVLMEHIASQHSGAQYFMLLYICQIFMSTLST